MVDFFPEIEISDTQAEAMARGMFAVARADGDMHPREAALVADFFADTLGGPSADLNALEKESDISPQSLALALGSPPHRRLFVKSCILLAYADGAYGKAESTKVAEYAAALDIGKDDLVQLEEQVKDYLLGHLSGIKNTDSVVAVAREMK